MKYYLLLALVVGQTVAAPLTESFSASGSVNSSGEGTIEDVDKQLASFEGILYLFAPDSWTNAWNATPTEGKKCFMNTAGNPANSEIYNSNDNEKIKADLQSKCASSYTQLATFCDTTDATMKQLPQNFLDASKAWGQKLQDLGKQYQSVATSSLTAPSASGLSAPSASGFSAPSASGLSVPSTSGFSAPGSSSVANEQAISQFKTILTQFSKPTAEYMEKLVAMTPEDRQKISAAFPKLEAFFSGDHAVELLNETAQIYKTMGSGNFDPTVLSDPVKKLVSTWGTVWEQYKNKNADGLKKAGALWKQDLVACGDKFASDLASKVNSIPSGSASISASASGPTGSASFASKFAENNPKIANEIKKRVEESKVKLEDAKDKIVGAFHDVSESGKTHLENAKNTAQQKWSELKDNAEQFKQNHFGQPSGSVNGAASFNENSASAGARIN